MSTFINLYIYILQNSGEEVILNYRQNVVNIWTQEALNYSI